MANISQITQELTQFGPAPDSLDPANFNQRGDATVKHLHTHVDEQNTITKQTNKVTREINERAADIDCKYDEIVEKYVDFTPKYDDFAGKYQVFVPGYNEIVQRHKEVEAHRIHIDSVKIQIDIALTAARSYINEGNGGVIDDTKASDVSTWSSNELKRRFDLKADEATAYKEWNYKTITGAYTAKNNDALFVEASSSFEITLPEGGKIKIIDKKGTFQAYNIKLVYGNEKLVLNKKFQRVELVFFEGKWRTIEGQMIKEVNVYSVSSQERKLKSFGFYSDGANRSAVIDNILFCTHLDNITQQSHFCAIDLATQSNVAPALPSLPSGYSFLPAVFTKDEVFLVARKNPQIKMFKFNTASKTYSEVDTASINSLTQGYTGYFPYIMTNNNKHTYIAFSKNESNMITLRIVKIDSGRQATLVFEAGYFSDTSHKIIEDFLFEYYSHGGSYTVKKIIDLTNKQTLATEITTKTQFSRDYVSNSLFAKGTPSAGTKKLHLINLNTRTLTEKTISGDQYNQIADNQHIFYDTITLTKQNATIRKIGGKTELGYTTYENNQAVQKTIQIGAYFQGFDNDVPITIGDKDIIIDQQNAAGFFYAVSYSPTIFTEEI